MCSVCIANYNGGNVLTDCIDSLLNQNANLPIEIIIHDDASTDGSLILLRERYPAERHPEIHIIESQENVGFCISNNRMADIARGDYLLLLNNDAALAPDALLTLYATARAQNPEGILTLPQLDWETGSLVDRGCLLDLFHNPVPNGDHARRDIAMVIGACLWLPRLLWQELGGFPESFESIAEDMHLCCRARLAGYPVQVTPNSYYRHRQGASFGGNRIAENRLSSTYRRRRLSERNKTFVMLLCAPPLRLWLTLPSHLLLLAIEGALLAVIKWDTKLWKTIYGNVFVSLAQQLPQLVRERKRIQRTRKIGERAYGEAFTWMPRKLQLLIKHGLPTLR